MLPNWVGMPSRDSYVTSRFVLVGGAVVVLEVILGSWPVVATAIWGTRLTLSAAF